MVVVLAAALAAPAITTPNPASAAAGAPVTLFGQPSTTTQYEVREGGAVHDIAGNEAAHDIVALGDGRLLTAGYTTDSAQPFRRDGLIARFTANGLLDPTFGGGDGSARIDVSTSREPTDQGFEAIALGPSDSAVAGGWLHDNHGTLSAVVTKVTSAGLPDPSFGGGDGVAVIDRIADFHETATDVAVTADGAVVVGIFARGDGGSTQRRYVTRLTAAGVSDATFGGGGDGMVEVGLGDTGSDRGFGYEYGAGAPIVALQGTAIVVAGTKDGDVRVERYLADGSVDTTFGTSGVTTVDVDGAGRVDHPTDLVVTTAGLFLSATTDDGTSWQGAVVHLDAAGAPKPQFGDGADGAVTIGYPYMRTWNVAALDVQPDGRVVIAGDGNDGGNGTFDFRFARLTATGQLDPVFDGDGFAHLDASSHEHVRDVVVAGERIVAAGTVGSSPDSDLALGAVDAKDGPLPMISIDDARMVEGELPFVGQLNLPLRLSFAVLHETRVHVETVDVDTSFDFFHVDGGAVFAPGETETFVQVSVGDDQLDENDERFRVVLSAPERAGIADGEAVVTIVDEDPGPAITAAPARTTEGSPLTFELRLSEPSPAPIRFVAATEPATAAEGHDYPYTRAEYSIPPGETSATFTVSTVDDDDDEQEETLRVRLFAVDNARSYVEPTGFIDDNDDDDGNADDNDETSPPPEPGGGPSPSGAPSSRQGYWMVDSAGGVYAFGDATWLGNGAAGAVDLEPTTSGSGYWIVTDRGLVSTHGDARHFGHAPVLATAEAVTSISRTQDGGGYWLFTTHGRVFPYGNATHYGDMAGRRLNGPVLDSIPTSTGLGYYMVASDGGIFTFGDAAFLGSMGASKLNAPVQSLVPDDDGVGYWLVASDGGIFTFDAAFHGSMGHTKLNKPVTGMVAFGQGYLMVAEDGGIFSFGQAPYKGSLGSSPPPSPVVAAAVLNR